ncbi:hypothetical protein ADT26_08465 [Xanthomonas oryzae]|nr:hypothetical protein AXO1947_10450 [Xanthomonas oryzae pv. oryzae]KOR44903.1 hypothetical protein ADT26_08465 [Xanthomonas oryzae]AUI90592.1 hypothetical protein BVV16_10975 [Xanthomonas oryzae pv. oryzae]AUI94268.1 hypothetical protein BVV17_10990 [Xanthomonas oryzae pv. oryzae]AUI97937.1 hypothetical protein BVV18_10990 [Xanthomonas oryzae pv. oryzae]
MQFVDSVGWLASIVLIATLIRQIYEQWRSHAAQNISRWLFLAQISASVLFVLYRYLVGHAVLIVSNALMLPTGLTGYGVQRLKCCKLERAAWMRSVDNTCRVVAIVSLSFSLASAVSPMQLPLAS